MPGLIIGCVNGPEYALTRGNSRAKGVNTPYRLSTVSGAGKIVDIGKHDRLLASSPVCQRLFELQFLDRLT